MLTTLRSSHPHSASEPSADTVVRTRFQRPRGLLTRRRGPYLLGGLILALAVFLTGGGGPQLYERVYPWLTRAGHLLMDAPGAPFAVFDPNRAKADRYRLHGVVYSPPRSLAVINQVNAAPGESVSIRVGKNTEVIRCVEVSVDSVRIETATGTIESLRLPPKPEPDTGEPAGAQPP